MNVAAKIKLHPLFVLRVILCTALFAWNASLQAATSLKVVKSESDAENLLKSDRFGPFDKGFTKEGDVFICDNGPDKTVRRGVSQSVVLDQKTPLPILAEAWSKAENVGGSPDADYSIYLDIAYMDGTYLWGQHAPFSCGTHDWQRKSFTVIPDKPVKSVSFYALFRTKSGKALFRDLKLSMPTFDESIFLFDGIPVIRSENLSSSPIGKVSLRIRDVAADSDFFTLEDDSMKLHSEIESNKDGTTITLESKTDEDRCLTLVYAVAAGKPGTVDWCAPRRIVPNLAFSGREMSTPSAFYSNVGVNGRLSRYPIATVLVESETGQNEKIGRCIGIDLLATPHFRRFYVLELNAFGDLLPGVLHDSQNTYETTIGQWGLQHAVDKFPENQSESFGSLP